MSPNQRHTGKSKEILDKRHEVYETAKQLHPERWTRETRDWSQVDEVWLNPEKSDGNVDKCIEVS